MKPLCRILGTTYSERTDRVCVLEVFLYDIETVYELEGYVHDGFYYLRPPYSQGEEGSLGGESFILGLGYPLCDVVIKGRPK